MLFILRFFVQLAGWLVPRSVRAAPVNRGARVQVSVMSGAQPALAVIHEWNGSWTVSDGVSDLDRPGLAVDTHLSRAALWDESIVRLASMDRGTIARRSLQSSAWRITPLAT